MAHTPWKRRVLAGLVAPALAASAIVAASGQPAAADPGWTGTWQKAAASVLDNDGNELIPGIAADNSVRMIAQTSLGGDELRLRISNVFGDDDLDIGHATVGIPVTPNEPDVDPDTLTEITFGGSQSVTIPQGEDLHTDPVPLATEPLSQLAITLYFPEATPAPSIHLFGKQDAYVYDGDQAGNPDGADPSEVRDNYFFLTSIEVSNPKAQGAVSVLGASISDGFGSTHNANTRWPNFLAEKVVDDGLGVVNAALSGNTSTHDGLEIDIPFTGRPGIERIDDDINAISGVQTVVVDYGLADQLFYDEKASNIIPALHEICVELKSEGYTVLYQTLTPGWGQLQLPDVEWGLREEITRQLVNLYIRSGICADGVVDADRAIRDPKQPLFINPDFDSGDRLHPNDLGAEAIADVVPLGLL